MATATSRMTIEEFHERYGDRKPYYEYWFGEAVPKDGESAGTAIHGVVQIVLALLLRARGWKPGSEIRLRIKQDFEPIPDLVASREKIEAPYPTRPVELCVEILSPDDRLKKVMEKAGYYLGIGVRCVWIIDPQARTAWVVNAEAPEGTWIRPDGALTAEGLEIPLAEVFAEADEIVGNPAG